MQIRLKEPHRQRAVVVSSRGAPEHFLEAMLLERGVVVAASLVEIDLCEAQDLPQCDMIIVYADDAAKSPVPLLEKLAARTDLPVMLVTATDDGPTLSAAIEAGAHAVLSIAVASDRLNAAILSALAVHGQIDGHRRLASQAQEALENRKLIERAKGIIMETRGLTEAAAFAHLQKLSMDGNQLLPEVAKTVIAAKALLG